MKSRVVLRASSLLPGRLGSSGMKGLQIEQVTPGQELIWLGLQKHPDVPIYNMITTCRIEGSVEHERFSRAVAMVVAGTDALRSTFHDIDGFPRRAVVDDFGERELVEYVDLKAGNHDFADWMGRRSAKPLDISRRCFDMALVRVSASEYVWYLNQHHIITDAWATKLIYERVSQVYADLGSPGDESRQEWPQFTTYLAEASLLAETTESDLAARYWQEVGNETSHKDPVHVYGQLLSSQETTTDRITVQLDADLSKAITSLADRRDFRSINRDTALFQVFSTALLALLHKASGMDSLSINVPVMNRRSKHSRLTVGLMMEIFGLLVHFDVEESFSTLYEKVRSATMEMFGHAYPGTTNAEILRASGAILNYIPGSFGAFDGMKTEVDFPSAGHAEPHTGLRVQVRALADTGGFNIDLDFKLDVFPQHLQKLIAYQYEAMLRAIVSTPEADIVEIDILPVEERDRLLVQLNATSIEYQSEATLHQQIFERAVTHPEQIAVVDGDETISYRELDLEADLLAAEMIRLGVEPWRVVALPLDPGISYIKAIFAALKAGATFMPLDRQLPDARQQMLLRIAEPTLMIGDRSQSGSLQFNDGSLIKKIDIGAIEDRSRSQSPTSPVTSSGDPAYLLFTSGSTGEPKGVVGHHRGVVNLLDDIEKRAPLSEVARCSLWTNVGFDVSIYEIFSALTYGRTLHIVPDVLRGDPEALFDWMVDSEIESAYLPPFMLEHFATRSESADGPLRLRRLLVGVEPIPQSVLGRLQRSNPGLRIVNGYGPTEATICATFYSVPREADGEARTPMGKPVQNNQAYVLDRWGGLLPFGVPGELFIGGVGVTHGYLNQPELTADAFVEDSFSESDTALYKTGDLVRYDQDERLVFIGRVDHQIKVGGHRIEPGEIELAIASHCSISEALVVATHTPGGSKRLAAYVIPNGGEQQLSPSEWLDYLSQKLPRYMIPGSFIEIDRIPQTPTGKVDRTALPNPRNGTAIRPDWVAPTSQLEISIAHIWEDILEQSDIGVHDHFFDLGGQSMEALRIASRARELGLRITPRDVFEYPTIVSLANWLDIADRDPVQPTPSANADVTQEEFDEIAREFGGN